MERSEFRLKNNVARIREDKLDYLSDEELQCLIESIEQEELIQAPHYMKQSILDQVESEERINAISTHRSSKVQLITYAMKVGVAAAAAIVLLVLIPVNDYSSFPDEEAKYEEWLEYQNSTDDKERYEEVWDKGSTEYYKENKSLYDTTNEICSKILEKTNKLFNREDK